MDAFKRAILLVLLFFLAALPAAAGTNQWTRTGDVTNIQVVAAHTSNASIMYASSRDFGLMKTTDGGANWSIVLASNFVFTSIVVDPQSPSTVYATAPNMVAFGAALYKSTDGGTSWEVRNVGLTRAVEVLVLDPVNPSTLYAVTRDGPYLFKTMDGAATWFSLRDTPLYSLTHDPVNSGRLYASTASGAILKSTDGGASWVSRQVGPPSAIFKVAVDPANPSQVFAAHTLPGGVYESTDAGDTWTVLPATLIDASDVPSSSVQQLLLLPGSPTTLFMTTHCRVFRSLDGGDSWSDSSIGLPFGGGLCRSLPANISPGPTGSGLLTGVVSNQWIFQYTHNASLLTPSCNLSANPTLVQPGGSSTLTAFCTPQPTSYVWSQNTGFSSTASSGTVSPMQTTTYTVRGVNANGMSNVASATVATVNGRVVNLSSRSQVLTGNDVMIAGFIIQGATAKTVVVRARGPSLAASGVANPLANPTVRLVGASTNVNVLNDDWRTASNAAAIEASGFAPTHDRESAVLATLPPGPYTAIVSGVAGGTGVGLVEVFEVDNPANPFANISTRARVGTGEDVLIAGFIIQGNNPVTLVVRGRGPSLAQSGVPNVLANPLLQLFSGQTAIASNDDWYTDSNAAQIQQMGYAPFYSQESAMLVTLQPGAYTAQLSGVNAGTGVGIIELFRLP